MGCGSSIQGQVSLGDTKASFVEESAPAPAPVTTLDIQTVTASTAAPLPPPSPLSANAVVPFKNTSSDHPGQSSTPSPRPLPLIPSLKLPKVSEPIAASEPLSVHVTPPQPQPQSHDSALSPRSLVEGFNALNSPTRLRAVAEPIARDTVLEHLVHRKSGVKSPPMSSSFLGAGLATRSGASLSPRALESARKRAEGEMKLEELLAKCQRCVNCDRVDTPVHSFCMECFYDEEERLDPAVYCQACDIGLHKGAMKSHRRKPFTQALGEPLAELPLGCPPLIPIRCRNCEEDLESSPVNEWCTVCLLSMCKDCSTEYHIPKRFREHKRFPFQFHYMYSANVKNEYRSVRQKAKSMSPATRTPRSARDPPQRRNSNMFGDLAFSDVIEESDETDIMSKSNKEQKQAPTEIKIDTVEESKKGLSTHTSSVFEPSSGGGVGANPGEEGDVLMVSGSLSLNGDVGLEPLSFRNSHNPFDRLGSGLSVVCVSVGPHHAAAVTRLGSLFTWGSNMDNALGVDTGRERFISQPLCVQFPKPTPVAQVACGFVHTICLTQQGEVYTWGSGVLGILGHPADTNRETPTLVEGLIAGGKESKQRVVQVACGQFNSGCIVKDRSDRHQLYIWGAGQSGQIGVGDDKPSLTPVLTKVEDETVPAHMSLRLPELVDLAFGDQHACAVTASGDLYVWGSNEFGQLGFYPPRSRTNSNEDATKQLKPRLLMKFREDGIQVSRVRCGERNTAVLDSRGDLWGFGSGESHQIGIMDNEDQFVPQRVTTLGDKRLDGADTKVVDFSLGQGLSSAVTQSGEVYLWGYAVETAIPQKVASLATYRYQHCAVGSPDFVALLTGVANELLEWQFEEDEEFETTPGPVSVNELRGVRIKSFSSGKSHRAVVTEAGKLFMWGSNRDIVIPSVNNTLEDLFLPTPLHIRVPYVIKAVACGVEHNVALTDEGRVLTWGRGAFGRLGHGNDGDVGQPTVVAALSEVTVVEVALGPQNTGVITSDYKGYVWGAGTDGQIGNDENHPQFEPVMLSCLDDVALTQLAFGNKHVAALTSEGHVYTWGHNGFFQCGLGWEMDEPCYLTPQSVPLFVKKPVQQIACGDNVTLAVTRDEGAVYVWGSAETKQCCVPDDDIELDPMGDVALPRLVPFPSPSDSKDKDSKDNGSGHSNNKAPPIKFVQASHVNCAALTETGEVYTWGWSLGELPTRLELNKNNDDSTSTKPSNNKVKLMALGYHSLMLAS